MYVGQTSQSSVHKRWIKHCSNARRGRSFCPKLYNHMRKHGIYNYDIIEIEQCSVEESEAREKHWIRFYDTFRNGCNLHPGGNQTRGVYHYMHKQRPAKHIIEASVASRIGKPLSEDHKANQRKAAAEGRNKRTDLKPVVCDQTGETWDSVSSCAKHFGVNTVAVIYRIRHQVERKARNGNALGNFTFSYVGEETREKIVHKAPKDSFEIRCNETGQVFKNMREACSVLNLAPAQLCNYFKLPPTTKKYTVRQVKGYTFTKN